MFAICASFVDTYRIYCGYDILIMLPLPIPAGKGGTRRAYFLIFFTFCCGKCSCLLYLQMVRQAFLSDN